MPATLKSLTKQQKQTLAYIIGFVLLLGLAGFMFFDGSRKKAESAAALRNVEQKESQAQSVQLPAEEEVQQWLQQEQDLQTVLISDQTEPELNQELSRLAADNRLERYVVNTEQHTIDPDKSPSPDELKLLNVGIKRYLTMIVTFNAQYSDAARFLSQVKNLQRSLTYKTIRLRRNPPFVDASVVMHIYKKEGA
ncbi:MAG: hypothetical protein HY646_00405 [Acidobacteria bacterium]|nr:hypothetical protein [Acidobacteriota bacterium]